MSWTDKIALETIWQLAKDFKIDTFIETGTYKGTNALVQSRNFKYVNTCEIVPEYIRLASIKLRDESNVEILNMYSPKFLRKMKKKFKKNTIFIYLDAHFYNPELPPEKRFVVLDELNALENISNCIIAIHDFDNGEFGHITYDGQSLNFELLTEKLKNVNKDFHYYTNIKTDIIKSGKEIGLEDDEEMISTLKFVWSAPEKTKRGILYCVPKELDLTKYNLRKL